MKGFFKTLGFALAGLTLGFTPVQAQAQVAAFPGAYGFGAAATGGRGGTVYHVTNLNDSGAGSFRDAVSADNRIVVFDVGGYVALLSAVSVSSDLTIEGQTAPGGGFGLMAAEVSLSGKNNIIIRNLRFRQGNEDPDTGKSAINMGTGNNIILDHCSFEYGQFDSVDAVGVTNFTVQNCIIADPIGQQFGAHVEVGPDTFYRNLWVNAHNRQPLAKADTQYINNVIYDYQAGYTVANTGGDFTHDIVGNYFIGGPNTTSAGDDYFQIDSNQSAYAVGNYLDSNKDGTLNGSPANTIGSAAVLSAPWASTTNSIPTLSMASTSSCQVGGFTSVIESCGAFPRDSVDQFVIGDVTSLGTKGTIYTNQANTGLANNGYGTLAAGTPFTETSGDGIPDYWATANGIGTTNAAAGTALYGSTGYTNLEVYANSLVLPYQWTGADLPGTPIQGASSFNTFTGQWLLAGSGAASASAITQGQFASQTWTSDGTLSAELVALTGSTAQGGLLLTGGGSSPAYVALVRGASGTLSFIWQSAGGSAQSAQATVTTLPLYLKITAGAGTYTGSYSTNGTAYTQLGQASLSLPATAQAGLILASGSSTALGTASFANLSITPQGCGTPTATPSGSTPTHTLTATPSSTATRTNTSVPPTATSTATATKTNTPTATPSSTSTGTAPTTKTNTPVPPTATMSSTPTNTPVPPTPTYTPVPPTATSTFTSVLPTFTSTPVPPTATFTSAPPTFTSTPVPPTATFTSVPPTVTFTNSPVPPTLTFTAVPPTSTNTPVPPTAIRTDTPVPPTPTRTNTPSATSTKTNTLTATPSSTPMNTPSNTVSSTATSTRTNTPAPPTPTPSFTPTPVPPTSTFTPTPIPPSATFTSTTVVASTSLKVQLLSGVTSDTTNSPHPQIQVVNTGTGPLNLNNVTVKYWFNCDCTNQTVQAWVDWAGLMPAGTTATGDVQVSVQSTTQGGQTNYVLYTFTGNVVLQPGQAIQAQSRFNKSDWSNMTQGNDWSFAPNTSFTDDPQATGYLDGSLVWGQEPVAAPAALTVTSALVFPNPSTGTGTTLSFNLNGTQTGPTGSLLDANHPLLLDPNAKITLSIYSLAMRLIWTQTLTGGAYGTMGNHEFYWSEKDLKGAGLANGLYVLRVTVESNGHKSFTNAKILILR